MRCKNDILFFADFSTVREEERAHLIMDALEEHAIPHSDCRTQGY